MDDFLKYSFDSEATQYDKTAKFLLLDYDFILNQAVQCIDFPQNERFNILDLGCGTGNLVKMIKENYPNASIYALDCSEEMIEIARNKNISNIKYSIADMFDLDDINLPYFDVIISSFVFHNFKSIREHADIFSLIYNHLSVNGKFIIADLIEIEDPYLRKDIHRRLIDLMRSYHLSNDEIARWLGILEVEDSPLTISTQIRLLYENGFERINARTFNNNIAIFTSIKKLDLIQLKAELLINGVKSNDFVKLLYLKQNPQNIWKTGNNGIFLSINGLDILIGINHKSNHYSAYEIKNNGNEIFITKYRTKLFVNIEPLKFPDWFFSQIPELDNKSFSEYFVYEGTDFLHLAYKKCSFSYKEKCKFCSTQRRTSIGSNVEELCIALSKVINLMPNSVQICLGGGTYFPLEENVEYFSTIVKCIRKHNKEIPIWIEMIPPKLEDIERLIEDGATSFGFNIEIWDDNLRQMICPGKSRISKEYYIKACKLVLNKLGSNKVGSCLIVGLDSYENTKEAIDILLSEGIEPCILPYKSYNRTNLGKIRIPPTYKFDFYRLSKYASQRAKDKGIIFNQNQGCLRCSCCTIMHDFQSLLL